MNFCIIGLCFAMLMCGGTANYQVPVCQTKTGYELIPKLDCKGYYICVFGKPVEMPDCPPGSVFSNIGHTCVQEDSVYNDCKIDVMPIIPDADPLTIEERCHLGVGLISHPTECHAFYNCSNKYNFVPNHFEQYLQECPYPEMFNTETMACDHFDNVKCGERIEFKNACKYRRNMCGGSHCMPCSVRFPNCDGKPDGVNEHEGRLWSPFYVMCYKGRTLHENSCLSDVDGRSQFFHPELNQCVPLDRIPKKHGGMMPDCAGQIDGFYLDDFGRCNQYTVCKNGKFLNAVKCMAGEVFDVLLEVCVDATKACGPCGNRSDC